MRAQVGRLVAPGFIGEAGAAQLREIPRYLAAVQYRRERLDAQVARDRQLMDQIADLQDAWLHQVEALPAGTTAERVAARRAVDAGGVPRLAVGPAPRHPARGERPADPQGAGLTPSSA